MNKRKYHGKKWHRRHDFQLLVEWHVITRGLDLRAGIVNRGLDPRSGIVNMGETWIDDMILNDPRMHKLGANPTARLLYYEGYIWSDREASGGIIDDVVLLGLCRGFEREAPADVEALVRVGLWERRGSGYYIVDFIESGHATRAERVAKQRKIKQDRRKAGKKGARVRWQKDGKPDGKSALEIANGWQPINSKPGEDAEF